MERPAMDTIITARTEHELALRRRIPASPDAVFAAWTSAERLKQWFGPYGMDVTAANVEPHPGGRFDITIRDAAGTECGGRSVITAITPGRSLAFQVESCPGDRLAGAGATVTVAPDPLGTRLDVLWQHPSVEVRAAHEAMGFHAGWGQMLDRLTAHATTPPVMMPGMTPPTELHGWLHRMLGEWRFETECAGPQGGPPMKNRGIERVRSLGGYWVVGESEGECPMGGGLARMVITMGYDVVAKRFRGSWVGSMMGHMFVYDGMLDLATSTLSLDTDGPSFTGQGTARYRDIVQLVSDSERLVTGHLVASDGSLTELMRSTFRRTA
jgi:uncharacterized protein YndB with AHSA1/START domain